MIFSVSEHFRHCRNDLSIDIDEFLDAAWTLLSTLPRRESQEKWNQSRRRSVDEHKTRDRVANDDCTRHRGAALAAGARAVTTGARAGALGACAVATYGREV